MSNLDDTVVQDARVRLIVVERQIAALNAEATALRRIVGKSRNGGALLAYRARELMLAEGPMHYRDLALRLEAGGDDPAATMLTALHRGQGVEQTARRSAIWRAVE